LIILLPKPAAIATFQKPIVAYHHKASAAAQTRKMSRRRPQQMQTMADKWQQTALTIE
jgi:hypothetical protein